MFSKNSVVVITWAKMVKDGKYTMDQVPKLFNLKEEVYSLLQNE